VDCYDSDVSHMTVRKYNINWEFLSSDKISLILQNDVHCVESGLKLIVLTH